MSCLSQDKDNIPVQSQESRKICRPTKWNHEHFLLHSILDEQLFDTWWEIEFQYILFFLRKNLNNHLKIKQPLQTKSTRNHEITWETHQKVLLLNESLAHISYFKSKSFFPMKSNQKLVFKSNNGSLQKLNTYEEFPLISYQAD